MAKKYPYWTGTYKLDPSDCHVIRRRRVLWKEPVAVFDFKNNKETPLTLWVSKDNYIRPFRTYTKMDFGSVPLVPQGLVSPTSSPRGFILHDSCYEFHAYWHNDEMKEMTRAEADSLLYVGMRADGCNKYLASKAWIGVKAGGYWTWNRDPLTVENARREAMAQIITATKELAKAGNTAIEIATSTIKLEDAIQDVRDIDSGKAIETIANKCTLQKSNPTL